MKTKTRAKQRKLPALKSVRAASMKGNAKPRRVTKRKAPKAKRPPKVAAPAPYVMTRAQKLEQLLHGLQALRPANKKKRTPFKIHEPFPGVVPKSVPKNKMLAMDNNISAMSSFAFGYGGWDQAGFLGYSFLSELSQITEYRRPAEILANEMTRKWGKLVSTSDDPQVKAKLPQLENAMKAFKIQDLFNKAWELDNFFGIGWIFIDTGAPEEDLKMPLVMDKVKVGKGAIKAFRYVEPMWTYPNTYNASDPLKENFYEPETWFVMGTEVHRTRLIKFISRPVPDMLKPAYLFGGVALTQLLEPYVNNWLQTRQSVSEITRNYSTPVLATDMDQMTTTGGANSVALRAQVYNTLRSNQGLLVCDKDKEEFTVVTAALGGLSELQAQAIEQMAFPSGIPLVKLLGVTPSGLNASSDGEVRTFYDSIASSQEKTGTPNIVKVIELLQLHLYGVIDPGIKWEWAQLWELDEEKKATVRKVDAETDILYMEAGILDGQAILDKLTSDPDSRYAGLDLSKLPEPGEPDDNDLTLSSVMGEVSAKSLLKTEEENNGGEGEDPDDAPKGARRAGRREEAPGAPANPAREARPAERGRDPQDRRTER